MAVATETAELSPPELSPKESFAALLDESLGVANGLEGTVIKGRVISIENDAALIDVGLKSEGRVALKEFAVGGAMPDLHVGDTVNMMAHDWKLVGIFESGKLARVCVKLKVLQELTGNPGHLSQIFIKVDDPKNAQAVVDQLRAKYKGYQIYTMEEFTSMLSISNVGMLKSFIGVVIGVAMVVGFIVVFMAMYTAVLERTREIGILKAVGGSSALILNILFRETLLLALFGSVVGIALTYATQWLMKHVVSGSLVQETVYGWWPIATGIAIAGALLGAIVPGVKAVKQDVTEALSYE